MVKKMTSVFFLQNAEDLISLIPIIIYLVIIIAIVLFFSYYFIWELLNATVFGKFKAQLTRYPIIIRLLIIIIILINLPLVIFFWGLNKYYRFFKKGYSSRSWPTTEGTINTSRVARMGTAAERSYKAIIKYSYSVKGTRYYSDQIYIGSTGSSGMKWSANRTVGRYPVGKKAIVYYDPTNPAQAVLKPGIKWTLAIFLLMPSFLLLLLLFVQYIVWFFLILFVWDYLLPLFL